MEKKETIITLRESHSTEKYTHVDSDTYVDLLLGNYRVL